MCVREGEIPDRGGPTIVDESVPLPILVTLIRDARLPEREVRAMSKAEAIARLAEFYTTANEIASKMSGWSEE